MNEVKQTEKFVNQLEFLSKLRKLDSFIHFIFIKRYTVN